MNQQELIEAVLREVKRALAERGIALTPAAGKTPEPSPARAAAAPAALSSPGGRDLTGKQVIVLKDLKGMSGGEVRVAQRAIMTPLAVDYIREKGIAVVRVDGAGGATARTAGKSGAAAAVVAVSPDCASGMQAVRALLEARNLEVREIEGQSYETAVNRLADAVASGSAVFGVCIERTGMEGPVHANRNRKVRAVHCRDVYEARAARIDIAANIVVIDSQSDPGGVIAGFTGME